MRSDQDRRDLYEALERTLGAGPAGTLMELLPPVGWSDLARQSDLVAVRGEIAEVRGEIGKVHGELDRLNARIDGQVAKFIWANVPVVASVAGLVLAAAKLA